MTRYPVSKTSTNVLRCSPAVLDFLRSTHVGRAAPPVEENWDSEDEVEEAEVAAVEEQAEK